MKRLFLVIVTVLLLIVGSLNCSPAQADTPSSELTYTTTLASSNATSPAPEPQTKQDVIVTVTPGIESTENGKDVGGIWPDWLSPLVVIAALTLIATIIIVVIMLKRRAVL